MADPLTPNLQLAQPLRGSDVGTWDIPVNGNTGILDIAFGGVTALVPTNTNITLLTSQAQAAIIRLTGAITANVAIVLPSIYKGWTIDNQLTNSISPSSFAISLLSTSGTYQVGIAPGVTDLFYDGTSIKYRNLGKLGEYWDFAGVQVPLWVSQCTIPPYLNCNGTSFSSVSYPQLATLLGTTTLPDLRGVSRATLNQGTGRITSGGSGIDGNTIFSIGGVEVVQLAASQIPTITSAGGALNVGVTSVNSNNIIGTVISQNTGGGGFGFQALSGASAAAIPATGTTNNQNVTSNNTGNGSHDNMQPTTISGITMIKAV